jgi:hypothetical protein
MANSDSRFMRKLMGIVPVFIAAPMLLAACGGDATPTTAPAATATKGAVATATMGSSVGATATKGTTTGATATTGSASGSEGVPTGSADLTIWYGYTGA